MCKRFGIAGWVLLSDWRGNLAWHYCDDVGHIAALCGKQTRNIKPTEAVDDIIGEPQENDCGGCRRRLEERRAAHHAVAS